jgi:hypothetical protein
MPTNAASQRRYSGLNVSRAHDYRVSWRDLSGRRRAARWTDDELDLYRSHALRSFLEAI